MLVLIVEDDENSRVLLEAVFSSKGDETVLAANGNEAMEAMENRAPDLIVSDILMPEMDGYDLCRAVKGNPALSSIPFVFYSATYTEPEDMQYAMELGASRFIVKPQEVDVFLSLVDEVMSEYRAGKLPSRPADLNGEDMWRKHSHVISRKLDKKVSDLKQERSKLKQSEARFQKLVESAPVGFFSATPEGWLLEANPALASMLGYCSPQDMLGDPELPPHPYLDTVGRETLPVLLQEHPEGVHLNSRLDIRDKGQLRLAMTIWPITDARECLERVEGVAMDVTRQKLADESLVDIEKIMAIGGVAAGMAHEINSPLTTIMGNIQVAGKRLALANPSSLAAARQEGLDVEAFKRFMEERNIPTILEVAGQAAKRVSTIVTNMLGYCRRTESRFTSHDILTILDKTLEFAAMDYDLRRHFDFRNIPVNKEYFMNLPLVICNPEMMQQVFFNILKNGAEAMGDCAGEGREPGFSIRAMEDDGFVRVEIEDRGPGMDEQTRARIFEPFFSTKSHRRGTGLGLSISNFIVTEKHHGELSVKSEPGRGSTFIIRLPISPRPENGRAH